MKWLTASGSVSANNIVSTNGANNVIMGKTGGNWLSVNTAPLKLTSPDSLTIAPYSVVEVRDGDQNRVFCIMSDGSVNVSREHSVDDAAKQFWCAIRKMNPFQSEMRIYRNYIKELERENNELKARFSGEAVVGSHLDDDGEGTG